MKKLLPFLVLFVLTFTLQAQYYQVPFINVNQTPRNLNQDQPDLARYYYSNGVLSYQGWSLLYVGTDSSETDGIFTPVTQIPFSFKFNGQTYNRFKASTSGVVTFDVNAATAPANGAIPLPDASIPKNSIALLGIRALKPTNTIAGSFIITRTFGTRPNRQFYIQFNSFSDLYTTSNLNTLSVVLEETTNKVYLVEHSASTPSSLDLSAGLQFDSTHAISVPGSPNLNPYSADTTSYIAFGPGTQPVYDITALGFVSNPYLVRNHGPFPIGLALTNTGTVADSSLQLNYSVNGGPTVSAPLTLSTPLDTLNRVVVVHPTGWQPSRKGIYTIKAWVSAINGKPDQDTTTLNYSIGKVTVYDSIIPRLSLNELFFSNTCPPCWGYKDVMENVFAADPGKSITIRYAQNFPSPGNDPNYNGESGSRLSYYGITGIPTLVVDGGFQTNEGSYTAEIQDYYQGIPSQVALSGVYSLDNTTRQFSFATVVGGADSISKTNLVLRVALVETSWNGHWNVSQSHAAQTFNQIFRHWGQSGTPLPHNLVPGKNDTLTNIYTHPASTLVQHFDSIVPIVFVQNKNTKEILQAATLQRVPTVVPPTVLASGPLKFCKGGRVTLTADSAHKYYWCTGATTRSITVDSSGIYWVQAINEFGIKSAKSANDTVVVFQTPRIAATGSLVLCGNSSVVLKSDSAAAYIWSNGARTRSITTDTAGTFSVVTVSTTGCTSAASAPVVVTATPALPTPVISFVGGGRTYITASTVANTYKWYYNGTLLTLNTQTIPTIGFGNYTVVAITASCTSSVSAVFSIVGVRESVELNTGKVYPNPFTDGFTMDLSNTTDDKLSFLVYDQLGKEVYNQVATPINGKVAIYPKNLATGVYTLKVGSSTSTEVYRIMKQ